MEYTVQGLAELAGVTGRTLRYYHQIGLLKPAKINSSGYRVYGNAEVGQLQQILFYRELGLSLNEIKEIISAPNFDKRKALQEHREKLLAKREQLDELISNVEKSIALAEGKITMSDKEKFAGFKKQLLETNEQKYGKEIRGKYGEQVIDESNAKVMHMNQEEHAEVSRLAEEIMATLATAMTDGADPAGELGQKAADLHRKWLCYYWPSYTKEAHAGLAEMYIGDPRFTAYYDQQHPGTASFLRDAILVYTGIKQ